MTPGSPDFADGKLRRRLNWRPVAFLAAYFFAVMVAGTFIFHYLYRREAARRWLDYRVATLNMGELFFDGRDNGPGTAPGQELREKARRLAEALGDLDAQLILLQGAGSPGPLGYLLEEMEESFPVTVFGPDTLVLAAGALEGVGRHGLEDRAEDRGRYRHGLLEVRLDYHGLKVAAFTAHILSPLEAGERRRVGAAAAARETVVAAGDEPGVFVVFGGDFNARPASPVLEALEEGGGLLRVAAGYPVERKATYLHRGRPVALSHIYVHRRWKEAYVPGSAHSRRDRERDGYGGCARAILVADFRIPAP